ncbi:MAG TPA: nodulation protein NfeD [Vicinamibacterales bacterium]|nr:nodulation protein NfeD [Vicinamibacterales bacterium]
MTFGLTFGLAASLAAAPTREPSANHAPVVYAAEVDSIIHPVSAEYMIATMDRADRAGATLVIFTLRTPGGLVDSTHDIVTHMLAARTPVAIFIAPSGARAASAGFLLTIAADVAAMAPGTHIGAAHPVAGAGEKMDEAMAKKAAADVAAFARTLASRRHRNVQLADEAVTQSRAFTEQEALTASPPLIDLVAADVPELLRRLDGRTITRFDGASVVLRTAGARVVPIEMNWRQRLLSTVAHPNVAYILLSLGMLGLTIELWSPGAVLPGVAGGLCLLLAFFAFQILPVNGAGLLLILFGLSLLVLEVKVASYGLLTTGGLASITVGSMILMDSSAPELQVSLQLVLPIVFGVGGIAAFLARLALLSQRQRPATGVGGMIGAVGAALTAMERGQTGRVMMRGEIWTATAAEPIAEGQAVCATDVHGLTLTVRRHDAVSRPGQDPIDQSRRRNTHGD